MKSLLFSLILILASCSHDRENPGVEIPVLTDMKYSLAYESFSKNIILPQGMNVQKPPVGTIHRGSLFEIPKKNPIPFNDKALGRGEEIYNNFCVICHGITGAGDGVLIPKYPNPPAYTSERVMKLSDSDLFKVISEGKKDMPAHKAQLSAEDRWKVIYYIRKLQGKE